MRLGAVYFIAILLAAFALVPAVGGLMGLAGRMTLPAADYLVAQRLESSWAWLFLPVSFIADVVLLLLYRQRGAFKLVALSALLAVCAMLVFVVWIYPVDQVTARWTTLPVNWVALRARWEYAHAANAVLTILSFAALALAAPVPHRRDLPTAGYTADILYVR